MRRLLFTLARNYLLPIVIAKIAQKFREAPKQTRNVPARRRR